MKEELKRYLRFLEGDEYIEWLSKASASILNLQGESFGSHKVPGQGESQGSSEKKSGSPGAECDNEKNHAPDRVTRSVSWI